MKDLKFKMAYTTDLIIFGIDSRKTKNAHFYIILLLYLHFQLLIVTYKIYSNM